MVLSPAAALTSSKSFVSFLNATFHFFRALSFNVGFFRLVLGHNLGPPIVSKLYPGSVI